jgi:GTPase SAR1 family protein
VGAVLVYDVTKQKSFTNIEKWLSEIKEWADTPNIIVMMLGNKVLIGSTCKVDREEEREVSKDAALQFAEANKMGFVETSAKTGANIDFAFKKLIEGTRVLVHNRNSQADPVEGVRLAEPLGVGVGADERSQIEEC